MERLPLLPNGKVDRSALPAPEGLQAESSRPPGAPRNAIETELTEIWCEVLSLGRVRVYEDFFDLGGHSLLATRVISRVHATFGVALTVRSLFDAPTIAGMAECIARNRAAIPAPPTPSRRAE